MKNSDYTDILWDFNGTLLDDVEAGIISVNTLLRRRGIATVDSVERYHEVFGFPIIDYYRRLGFDLENESYENKVAPEWMAEYLENSKAAGLRKGVSEMLEFFKEQGVRQTIISASETGLLKRQLKELRIDGYFDEIYGLDNINAGSKTALAIKWKEAHPDARALFIGDTDHDAETAKAINAECVLVAGGHQSESALRASGYAVAKSFSELKFILINEGK